MLSRLLALLVLCGALGVSGQDAPTPASYILVWSTWLSTAA
jgi:hypothetical protein